MRRRAVYWPVMIAAALLVGLLAYGLTTTGTDNSLDEAVAKGGRPAPPAPTTALPLLGTTRDSSLAAYKGKVVLVNMWASWCDPCRDELPLLRKTQATLAARGGTILGIDVKENSGAALAAVRKFGLEYPSLRDRDGSYSRKWGITGYPETFVIDRAGKIAAIRRMPVTQAWLDATLPPLLAEKA
jgi:cytochrome c biogenesis protein CcmG/thiol:disulfide interchange protein DsbE